MARQHSTRISAGLYRYRIIQQPGSQTRPVTQKVRAAIFNTLGQDLTGFHILDAFAGSGALGFEALSRGADRAHFVDKDNQAIGALKTNVEHLGVASQVIILHREWSAFVATNIERFTIIFLDPPYDSFQLIMIEQAANMLSVGGIIVVSTSDRVEIPEQLANTKKIKSKRYGHTIISYFQAITS